MKNLEDKIESVVIWNCKFYGIYRRKRFTKYYKANNVRFDNAEEITMGEYDDIAERYARAVLGRK